MREDERKKEQGMRYERLGVSLLGVSMLWVVACGGDGGGGEPCSTTSDCSGGRVCRDDRCVALPERDGGGVDSGADAGLDPMGDEDGDGLSNGQEGYEEGVDSDGDGIADYLDPDSDGDGLPDAEEGREDWDGDGVPNAVDPRNDGEVPALRLTRISTAFNTPIAVDYHEPSNALVLSVNYSTGLPHNFELVHFDGSNEPFSSFSGLSDEVKIATVRSGAATGFTPGELFVGNGVDGQIVRITADGTGIDNPWVDLPGEDNGLLRGGLHVDRTGIFGGDLIVVTTGGEVWRVAPDGTPTRLADVDTHLEGVTTVPDAPARYGPLAGKILVGAEAAGGAYGVMPLLYAIGPDGSVSSYELGVAVEDVDIVAPNENFFGVNYGTRFLLGAPAEVFRPLAGDILLTQEQVPGEIGMAPSGLYVLRWDGTELQTLPVPLASDSDPVGQWEHVTFAPAGVREVPPIM